MPPQTRTDSVQRRPEPALYRLADLTVDTGRVAVSRDGQPLAVAGLSFDLLVALIEAAPRVASQDELMDRVWNGLIVGPETVSQRIKLLRDALGDDPKHPRYVAGVRGRGYRLVPDAVRVVAEADAAPPAANTPLPAGRRPRWQAALAAAGLAAIVGLGSWWLLARDEAVVAPPDATTSPPPAQSVAVLAFEDRGGSPGTADFAEGIPETVLHRLARMPGLTVIARGSSFAFRGRAADLRDIGRRLNVRYLLEGSVQIADTRLRVTSSLVDAQSGASVWSMQFDRAPTDVFAVQDEIAVEVARAMQLTLAAGADAAASLRRGATTSYEAYLAFLRGRALLESARVGDLPAAVKSLSAAIRHDPKFAGAYVLLARAQVALAEQSAGAGAQLQQAVGLATRLLDRAIELDPSNGEAWVERGYLKGFDDVAGADADFRRGLELSPSYARGYEGLAAVMFQSVARRRDALELIERARRLDPLASRIDVLKASYLFWGVADVEQSATILEGVLEREPLYVPAITRLAEVRWAGQGEFAEAAQLAEQAVSLDPDYDPAWQILMTSYLDMDEPAAAESAAKRASADRDFGALAMAVYRSEWQDAGRLAYRMAASGKAIPRSERAIALAIAQDARASGNFGHAAAALSSWALVDWDVDEAVLQGQLDMGHGVTALAEVLLAGGRKAQAAALLEAFLADTRTQVDRYGRGAAWLDDARAKALVLLGRGDEATRVLEEQQRRGFGWRDWRMNLEQPALAPLRPRREFQALLAAARGRASKEREQLRQMRGEGLVPERL